MIADYYETRRHLVAERVWNEWTAGVRNVDPDIKHETMKTVADAVNNTYNEGMSNEQWIRAALKRLNA